MSKSTSFSELIDVAIRMRWCTRPMCTTCGSHPFRNALEEISRDDVISGLRQLSDEFLSTNKNMFRLIIQEISFFHIGGELLEPLAGTPAAAHLQRNIDFINNKYEKRKAYEAMQTPEAIALRRSKKKIYLEERTQPHRDRKAAQDLLIKDMVAALSYVDDEKLLNHILEICAETQMKSIGGITYNRLLSHYKKFGIKQTELDNLRTLSLKYIGYWRKLYTKMSIYKSQ
jgi:hypothetical protein